MADHMRSDSKFKYHVITCFQDISILVFLLIVCIFDICIYTYMYTHIGIKKMYTCIHIHIHICIHTYVYVYINMYIHMYVYIHIYVFYICVHVYTCVEIYWGNKNLLHVYTYIGGTKNVFFV